MQIDTLRVTQFAFVADRGDTCVLSIVENAKTGDTLRKMERFKPYPLFKCARDSWQALRDTLIDIAAPRVIRVNSNVLGVFQLERSKDGYKETVIRDRRFHDNELQAMFAARSCDELDGDEKDEPDEKERENDKNQ